MKILIDTNVIMDVLQERLPHYDYPSKAFNLIVERKAGYITATQTKDIFYFVEKEIGSEDKAKQVIMRLCKYFDILDVLSVDVENALNSDMSDYEDALIAQCAARCGISYIITRNIKDFEASPVPAISPKSFLEIKI